VRRTRDFFQCNVYMFVSLNWVYGEVLGRDPSIVLSGREVDDAGWRRETDTDDCQ
jgi:hypothetical protein